MAKMPAAQQAKRNMNPHAEARFAMWKWSADYAAQGGGVMDYWDRLSERDKRLCYEAVDEIVACPRAPALAPSK